MSTAAALDSFELPFIRYARISRLGGRERGANVSIREQDRATTSIARAHGLPVMPELIADEDVSGATFDRPGWERAVDLVNRGEAAGIIAFDLKRISRGKTGETLAMIEDVESVGGELYDGSGRVSVSDADAELIATVQAMIARRDHREKSAYLAASVRQSIDRGAHLTAPFGYAKGDDGRLVPVEHEAPAVVACFEQRAAGASWNVIAMTLNEQGDVMPRPHTRDGVERQARWSGKGVRRIVQNRVYSGTAYNGKHVQTDAHPAIVSDFLFRRANASTGTTHARPSEGYLLTGLVRCSGCGHAMVSKWNAAKTSRYYACANKSNTCEARVSIPADKLDAHVWGEFEQAFLDVELVAVPDDSAVTLALAEHDAAREALSRALTNFGALGDVDDDERAMIAQQLADARARVKRAKLAVTKAQRASRGADLPDDLDGDTARSASVSQRRHWLALVYACVVARRSVARGSREPVSERVRLVSRDEAPTTNVALIEYARADG